ncbi:MAG: extracellular solute-binding protein, partial [Candidatus Firestonebacteria bacterium]
MDLTDVMKTDSEFQDRIKNDFQPNLMNAILFKGKYAAIPGWCNPVIMYYNKDIFDKEKLKYPDSTWDWNTFVNNCKKLTKDFNNDGRIDQYGTIIFGGGGAHLILKMNGIEFISSDGKKCNIDKPLAIDAMRSWSDMINKYHVAPSIGQLTEMQPVPLFMTGKIAMLWSGIFAARDIKKVKTFKWDIALLPKGKQRATVNWLILWAIPIQTKHPVEAWEFIKFLNGPIGQTIRFNYNGDLSVLKSVVKKEVIDTNIISENGDVITESLKYSYVPYAG